MLKGFIPVQGQGSDASLPVLVPLATEAILCLKGTEHTARFIENMTAAVV